MARKKGQKAKADPSLIYSYEALTPAKETEADKLQLVQVEDQMFKRCVYRNQLVELERTRRQKSNDLMKSMFGEVRSLEDNVNALKARVAEIRSDVKEGNARRRKKQTTPEQRAELKTLFAELKVQKELYKATKAALWQNPELKAQLASIEEWALSQVKVLRSQSGLYWGNYLSVEQSMEDARNGPPPKFHRWEHEGKVAVQLQKGLSIEEALEGQDRRLRIEVDPLNERRATIWFRIGSQPPGLSPLWFKIAFVMHRPLPSHGWIKWAYLERRWRATHMVWKVQFVLSDPQGWSKPDQATSGLFSIDPGWRKLNGQLRVATFRNQDGHEWFYELPSDRLRQMDYIEELQSTRDISFDGVRSVIKTWANGGEKPDWLDAERSYLLYRSRRSQSRPARRDMLRAAAIDIMRLQECWAHEITTLPEWLTEALTTLHSWKSHHRLSRLITRWRNERFAGDIWIFPVLEWWRRQDKHLYEMMENLRANFQDWRENAYRKLAVQLRRQYETVIMEDIDWGELKRKAKPEDEKPDIQAARRLANLSSPGRLLAIFRENMAKTAVMSAKNTTQRCSECGHLGSFDAVAILAPTCEKCGETVDQDIRACRNLMKDYYQQLEDERSNPPAEGSPESEE